MLKDILVYLDDREHSDALQAALHMAERHSAHLSGLYVTSLFQYVAAKDVTMAGLWDACMDELRSAPDRAQRRYDAVIGRTGVRNDWRHVQGDPATRLSHYGRAVDLIVLGQPMEDAPPILRDVADKVLLAAGRPVLIVPTTGFSGSLGKRVLVAWDGSREAARAVSDAVPLLAGAKQVIVMAVDPPAEENEIPCAEIALHLARHGMDVEAVRATASDSQVGQVLVEQAGRRAVDLIVIGAYGHSRLAEIMLGGVTRYMLKHTKVPILMSH